MSLRVVIAEDNRVYREGVRAVLEYGGEFEVVAAVDGPDELLARVDELEPDAVITDIRMPPTHHMEGIEAAHEIRRRHPGIGILVRPSTPTTATRSSCSRTAQPGSATC